MALMLMTIAVKERGKSKGMSRYIDADALLKGYEDHELISTHLIWNAPTADVVEVGKAYPREEFEKYGLSEWKDKHGQRWVMIEERTDEHK